MWSAAPRYPRETRSWCLHNRDASSAIYMHIFSMPVISPIAIIHWLLSMCVRRRGISDIIPSHGHFDCEYFSRNGASSTWSTDMVVKGDTSPPSSAREKEKKREARLVLLIFLILHAIVPQVYRRRDGGLAIASRCTRTPKYIFPTRRAMKILLALRATT